VIGRLSDFAIEDKSHNHQIAQWLNGQMHHGGSKHRSAVGDEEK
jgi:hypothetical protein